MATPLPTPLSGVCISQESLHDRLWKVQILLHQMKKFSPGQYLAFFTEEDRLVGYFSIASSPEELPFVTLYTRGPIHCEIGQELKISQPLGQMIIDTALVDVHYVLCAGGTGIAPFLSIVKSFSENVQWSLIWSVVDHNDQLMLEGLSSDLRKRIHMGLYPDENDRMLFETIANMHLANQDKIKTYYLAGPMVFIEKVGHFLIQKGVQPKQIFSDMKNFS